MIQMRKRKRMQQGHEAQIQSIPVHLVGDSRSRRVRAHSDTYAGSFRAVSLGSNIRVADPKFCANLAVAAPNMRREASNGVE